MKKTFKRAGVAVLSMAMLLSMGAMTAITSNAADATITINTGKLPAGSSLKVYKVATVDSSGEWAWSTVLPTSITSSYKLNGTYTADNAKAAAAALAEWITDTATDENKTALGEKSAAIAASGNTVLGSTQGVDNTTSYYLIIPTSTDAGKVIQPIMVEAIKDSNKDVDDLKMSDLPFDKKITAVSATIAGKDYTGLVGKDGDTGAGAVGDTVSYQITTQFPTYAANVTATDISNFVVTDTPTNISLKTGTVKVYIENGTTAGLQTTGSDADTDVTSNANLTVNEGTPTGGFTATFNGTLIKANEGKNVYITYDSTIAATATYFATGNPNTASLTYGNEYATGGGSGTAQDRTTVYTAKLNLKKTGSDKSGANLDGATFQLLRQDTSGDYNVIATSTGTSGDFEFTQLAPGKYKLHESAAPDGYLAIDDVSFTVSANSQSTQSDVDSNNTAFTGNFTAAVDDTVSGFSFDSQKAGVNDGTSIKATVNDPKRGELPGTGGMGTVLFTVGGAAVVLLAGALFVVYMRRRKVEE